MELILVTFLCSWAAVASAHVNELTLEADWPFKRVAVSHEATVHCCYRWKENPQVTWIVNTHTFNGTTKPSLVNLSDEVTDKSMDGNGGVKCHSLSFKKTSLSHTGLYQCKLNLNSLHIFTHGTFLQVYIPLQKSLNLSESTKNSIITAEGVLLLLCVLIPGTIILCKSKRLHELDKKKGREEENIYEGLNLDDCNSAYHQIQRSSQQGPYQDVAACGANIQLETP